MLYFPSGRDIGPQGNIPRVGPGDDYIITAQAGFLLFPLLACKRVRNKHAWRGPSYLCLCINRAAYQRAAQFTRKRVLEMLHQ